MSLKSESAANMLVMQSQFAQILAAYFGHDATFALQMSQSSDDAYALKPAAFAIMSNNNSIVRFVFAVFIIVIGRSNRHKSPRHFSHTTTKANSQRAQNRLLLPISLAFESNKLLVLNR